ncbi:hypothetical protein PT974_12053 [Cladobotryum mycophilum]|uniref:Uncharacterized protein n=1 Tax=Cladobotryum mycophilum TaxID=491253 RepID=A0ABR0S7V8_9HYPO
MAPFLSSIDSSLSLKRWLEGSPTPASLPTHTILARQSTITVVATDGDNDGDHLSGGAIAGIVIGSVVGFLLLLWIIRSCFNLGAPPQEREFLYHDVDPKHHHHHHHRHSSRQRSRHSSDLSAPPPVVVRERSRSSQRQPTYIYKSTTKTSNEYNRGRKGRDRVNGY